MNRKTGEITLSQLKANGFVEKDVKVIEIRNAPREYDQFVEYDEKSEFAVCIKHRELITIFDPEYSPDLWRIFLDANSKILVVCLLHNGNHKATIPLAVSKNTKESYERMQQILELLDYQKNRWLVVGDLKMVAILRGLQLGRPKHPCPYCLWDCLEKNLVDKYDKKCEIRDDSKLGR